MCTANNSPSFYRLLLTDKLTSELPSLVPELVSLVRAGVNNEVKGHALSALVTMVTHYKEAVVECRRGEVGLESALSDFEQSLSPEDQHEVSNLACIQVNSGGVII